MPFPRTLIALGVIGFFIFSLSIGGLTWWLLRGSHSTAAPNREQAGVPPHPRPLSQRGEGGAIAGAAESLDLFNGLDLEGWDYDPAIWSVRDGVIHGNKPRSGAGSGLFWRDSDIADFELRFRFRLIRGNSGVGYRGTRLANFDVGGYEFEIFTNKTGNLANVGTDRQRYRLHRAPDTAEPTDSAWHEAVIIAQGTRLVHMLDGQTLCDVEDTNPAAIRSGVIAFGVGGETAAEFKDIRLKRLKSPP
jgi:hypothetical protein